MGDLPVQAVLRFQPCEAELAASYLQALAVANGASLQRHSAISMYAQNCMLQQSDPLDRALAPFDSRASGSCDLRRAINNLQFWSLGVGVPPQDRCNTCLISCVANRAGDLDHKLSGDIADWSQGMQVTTEETRLKEAAILLKQEAADLGNIWKLLEDVSYSNTRLQVPDDWVFAVKFCDV